MICEVSDLPFCDHIKYISPVCSSAMEHQCAKTDPLPLRLPHVVEKTWCEGMGRSAGMGRAEGRENGEGDQKKSLPRLW